VGKDYELVLKVKNAPMLDLMRSHGIETAAELSRATGVTQVTIGRILNLKSAAFSGVTGKATPAVEKLCEFFGCLPEHLFPEGNLTDPLRENTFTAQVYATELKQVQHASTQDPSVFLELLEEEESVLDFDGIMDNFLKDSPRYAAVLQKRFKEGKTLEATGTELGITRERVRQMEHIALRRLRRGIIVDSEPVYDPTLPDWKREDSGRKARARETQKQREILHKSATFSYDYGEGTKDI
jgi:hypothetical protein